MNHSRGRSPVDLIHVRLGRDTRKADVVVDRENRSVLVREPHRLRTHAEVLGFRLARQQELGLERILRATLVAEMQLRQPASGFGEGMEVAGQRDARQFLREVVGELLAICGRVKNAVDVIEDLVLGDGQCTIVRTKGGQCSVGDVVDALEGILQKFGLAEGAPVVLGSPIGGSTVRTRGSGGRAYGR